MIDWTTVQARLNRVGYPCGVVDGQPGPKTWTALLSYAAGRQPDDVLRALGKAAAAWLAGDAIAQTPQRLAEFVAQTANETGGYTRFEEDLRYSAATLCKQWPTHFTPAQAAACVGKPIELASRAYGGRNGNASWPSTDGHRYRGRGCLQLTGRSNYAKYGAIVDLPLVEQPDLAADPADSLVIAIAFWRELHVNDAIDRQDYARARKLTNGGTIGLVEVARRRAAMLQVLA